MAVEVERARRRFTRAEYHRMAEVGILGERDRVELIRGEIVEVTPAGRRHKAFVNGLAQLLTTRLAGRAVVWVQTGIVLGHDTEPAPDITVLRRRSVPYKDREAHADDVLLLIEVADASLGYDRTTKAQLYAAAAVPEYWVVDCTGERVEVHRGPRRDGYRDVSRVGGVATLTPMAFPDVSLTAAEIFA